MVNKTGFVVVVNVVNMKGLVVVIKTVLTCMDTRESSRVAAKQQAFL